MGIREWLEKKSGIVTGLACALVLVALVLSWQTLKAGNATNSSGRAFYSTDDGKTWFADSAANVAPFETADGVAVRAIVFSCGGEEFVNHLEEFRPEERQEIVKIRSEAEANGFDPVTVDIPQGIYTRGREVKRPGDKEWISAGPESADLVTPHCPHNGEHYPVAVKP